MVCRHQFAEMINALAWPKSEFLGVIIAWEREFGLIKPCQLAGSSIELLTS
jgi:hypothetical protein